MTRIPQLLGTNESDWQRMIQALHAGVGSASHDVSVIGDIIEQSAAIKKALKLDPIDTTPKELYASLRERLRQDNKRLAKSLGIIEPDAPQEATAMILAATKKMYKNTDCFVMKYSRVKKLLKDIPPKNLMQALHYRSVDSMLKHIHPAQVITVARFTESAEWQQHYAQQLKVLTPTDFETRPIEFIAIDDAALVPLLEKTMTRHHCVLHAKEIGCVAIAPTRLRRINAYTIRTMSLLIHYIQEVRYFSTLTKVIVGHKNFAENYYRFLITHQDSHAELAKRPFHWRAVQRAVYDAQIHDVFPPHVVEDDWKHQTANNTLIEINPHVSFWDSFGYVVAGSDDPVSCNIIDLSIDESYEKQYEARSLKYGRRELEQEVLSRYIQEPRVHRVILQRLGL